MGFFLKNPVQLEYHFFEEIWKIITFVTMFMMVKMAVNVIKITCATIKNHKL